jgi:hypothetical protein
MNNVTKLLLERAKKAEWRLSVMTQAADEIEAICDKEIETLKARIRELELEQQFDAEANLQIEDEDGTIAHMKMLERRDEEAAHRNGSWCEDPAWD